MAEQESRLADTAMETAVAWWKACGQRTIATGPTFQPVSVSQQSNGGKDTYFILGG